MVETKSFNVGDKVELENYTECAIWCNENGYTIQQKEDGYYITDIVPVAVSEEKASENTLEEKRAVRNRILRQTDKYVLPDFPIDSAELKIVKSYRRYLRNFFDDEESALRNQIMSYEEFKETL